MCCNTAAIQENKYAPDSNSMRSGPTTSADKDTLSSGNGASPFATAAKRSTTRVGREGSGFESYRQVEDESILATDDIHGVPNCSSQHRHLNHYQVQVCEYEHISLANAWFSTTHQCTTHLSHLY